MTFRVTKINAGKVFVLEGQLYAMEQEMSLTYLTTQELSGKIKYDARTIRNCLKDSVLLEGVHYIRPFGGRKILFIWEAIERDIGRTSAESAAFVTRSSAHALHG